MSPVNHTLDATQLQCLATTGDRYCREIVKCNTAWRPGDRGRGHSSQLFRDAQFSGDGTTIVAHNEDQHLRTFVLPPQLLDGTPEPHHLEAYSTFASPTNIQSYTIHPGFDLQDPSTTLVLSASADQPLRLSNALHFESTHARYPLVKQTTEQFLKASSLAFTADGRHFIAGSSGMISVFDTLADGCEPVVQQRTHVRLNIASSTGMRSAGIVSALSLSTDNLLAAGTTEREVALYDHEGRGGCTTTFTVGQKSGEGDKLSGHGITKLAWSPSGIYLLVAERQSDVIQIYDVRNTFQRVAWLTGRKAQTPQRLGFDVVPTAAGYEVWAGGVDGCVRMWVNPGSSAGEQVLDGALHVHDGKSDEMGPCSFSRSR